MQNSLIRNVINAFASKLELVGALKPMNISSHFRPFFPVTENLVYLDAAHQTPLSSFVRDGVEQYLNSSIALAGPKTDWIEHVEVVRGKVAAFLGCNMDDLAFTKNTSEGINIAANGLRWVAGDNVVILDCEHPNNVYAWLSKRNRGLEVRLVPNDPKGWADIDTFLPFIDERTVAVSISHIMFHNGQMNDVNSIVEYCRPRNIEVLLDLMQTVGVEPVSWSNLGSSIVSSGTHKGLLTPQGVGLFHSTASEEELSASYVSTAGVAKLPADLIADSDNFELKRSARRFEIGNYNILGIYALGMAVDSLAAFETSAYSAHFRKLGEVLIDFCDEVGIPVVGSRDPKHRSPNIYVLSVPHDSWLPLFEDNSVRVSPVRDGIRVSFGVYNDLSDLDRLFDLIRVGLTQKNLPVSS